MHCRCGNQVGVDLPINEIEKIITIGSLHGHSDIGITLSGGEPICHSNFIDILGLIKKYGINNVNITTNGSSVTDDVINELFKLDFDSVNFSISLDNPDKKLHNYLRRSDTSFDIAIKSLNKISACKYKKISASVRSVILPGKFDIIDILANMAIKFGCNAIIFSMVFPTGNALHNIELLPSQNDIYLFNNKLTEVKSKYDGLISISTNEPTYHAHIGTITSEHEYNGCVAGTAIMCVSETGNIKPCSILDLEITSILNKNIDEIICDYVNSSIIHKLLDRNITGKCSDCEHKMSCGGCRARALKTYNDYLAEDPMCLI
jgi:radical SAM protein with 4Fe4S-binding SPASM domain